jgi:tripartite-type tricarboxylate transporter receptor subunit TctC
VSGPNVRHRRGALHAGAVLLGASALGLAPVGRARAQATTGTEAWPTRPLRIVVAFAPGSGNDQMARLLAPKLAAALGQAVVVENRAGAGGMLGTEAVARAAPDGYTLGLGTSSQLVMNPALYRTLPYDVDRDLATVGLISRASMVLAARKDLPHADLRALIAWARSHPRGLTYGSAGNGSISHIVAEHFRSEAGIELVHVPYKGNGPALQDLLAGQIDLLFDGFTASGPAMRQGQLRILATNGTRSAQYPDVPSFADMGLPAYEAYTWNCLFAPRGVPAAVLERLNRELNRALAEPDLRARIEGMGAESLAGSTLASADAFGVAQRAKWIPIVRAMRIAAD